MAASDADEKGKGKDRAYQAAMWREAEGGEGWFESMRCARTDHFIPLAYESNGEWGTRAKEFFKLVCEIAGTEGTRSADCYHWSTMTDGRHWRHRVAVILGRGRVWPQQRMMYCNFARFVTPCHRAMNISANMFIV